MLKVPIKTHEIQNLNSRYHKALATNFCVNLNFKFSFSKNDDERTEIKAKKENRPRHICNRILAAFFVRVVGLGHTIKKILYIKRASIKSSRKYKKNYVYTDF
jgi:hypothetical protein